MRRKRRSASSPALLTGWGKRNTSAVTSASIGSVSVSYGNIASIDLSRSGQARELYDAARRYLDIYRG